MLGDAPRTRRRALSVARRPEDIASLGYFLPLPLPLALLWAKSLAATLVCAFVADLLASCLPAKLASFLLVAIASILPAKMNRPDSRGVRKRTPSRR